MMAAAPASRKSRISDITTVDARNNFSDVLNRAAYGKERILLTRRTKPIAAIVPAEDLQRLGAFANEIDVTTVEARNNFSEVVNRAAYGKERILLTRRGKTIAAIVPAEDFRRLTGTPDRGRHELDI
jgi:prevent-host-death family protein